MAAYSSLINGSYVSTLYRFGVRELFVKSGRFEPTQPAFVTLVVGESLRILLTSLASEKKVSGLLCVVCVILNLAVLTQYWRVTDTDRDNSIYQTNIALRGKNSWKRSVKWSHLHLFHQICGFPTDLFVAKWHYMHTLKTAFETKAWSNIFSVDKITHFSVFINFYA